MDLQAQIDELKREIDSLKQSNTIPREIETAFRNRIGDIKEAPVANTTYQLTITSGDTITLPNITAVLPVKVKGKTYNLLYQ